MRKCVRPEVPQWLSENAADWNERWRSRKSESQNATFQWAQHQGRPVNHWLREALAEMTQEHCAFCDSFPVEPDSVEHFRPKSDVRFLHLAYEWSNLYFCCGGCQKAKREQWDDRLLQPDAIDFQFERYFEFDFTCGQLKASSLGAAADKERADVTIATYQLDSQNRRRWRRLALRRWQNDRVPEIDLYPYRDYLQSGPQN